MSGPNVYEHMLEKEFKANQTYMYTPFCGADFLKAYFHSRKKQIKKLAENLAASVLDPQTVISQKLKDSYQGQVFGFNLENSEKIDSCHVLLSLVVVFEDRRVLSDEQIKWWIDRFVQRFEVSKRIYASYSTAWKKETTVCQDIYVYALLSYLCLGMYKKTLKAKYLNCVLKLNDYLVNADKSNLAEDEIQLIVVCFEQEMRFVEQNCQESKVLSYGA